MLRQWLYHEEDMVYNDEKPINTVVEMQEQYHEFESSGRGV